MSRGLARLSPRSPGRRSLRKDESGRPAAIRGGPDCDGTGRGMAIASGWKPVAFELLPMSAPPRCVDFFRLRPRVLPLAGRHFPGTAFPFDATSGQPTGGKPTCGPEMANLQYFKWSFIVTAAGLALGGWLGWTRPARSAEPSRSSSSAQCSPVSSSRSPSTTRSSTRTNRRR